jgi:serine/threonine-protein kinase
MGIVYRARHVELEKVVALKTLSPEVCQVPELHERFRREPQAASHIGHPNIIEILDAGGAPNGSIYFVMEYLNGKSLEDEIAGHVPMSIDRVIVIGIQICAALAAAHDVGLVHRDIKPRHIFLVERGNITDLVKVLDFGVVKNMKLDDDVDALTQPGVVLGTPTYMAPEQGDGQQFDHRIDIYSLGVVLYEMLTGKPPHPCQTLSEAIVRKATEPVVPARKLRREVPAALQKLVHRCLEYKASDRPQSAKQIGDELRELLVPDAIPPVLRMLEFLQSR